MMRNSKQRDDAFKAEDFAVVAIFCAIGLGLSYAAILGAPDIAVAIAKAFATFCPTSPAA